MMDKVTLGDTLIIRKMPNGGFLLETLDGGSDYRVKPERREWKAYSNAEDLLEGLSGIYEYETEIPVKETPQPTVSWTPEEGTEEQARFNGGKHLRYSWELGAGISV